MQDLAHWLEELGMSEYAQRFAENDIDIDLLGELTDEDFDRLGVSLGHRRRMLRAIRELGASPTTTDSRQATAPTASKPSSKDTAERRQVTVLFSDLVGSTALAARMDPASFNDLFDNFLRQHIVSGHRSHKSNTFPTTKATEAERGNMRLAAPWRMKFGPEGDDQQNR